MQVLTELEVKEFFDHFPNGAEYVHRTGSDLLFVGPEARCIDLEYPQKLERMPFFARYLATLGYDQEHFNGALLWFTEWGVWDPRDEAPGYRLIEAMRSSAGHPSAFEGLVAHRYRADELTEAIAGLLQPMVFGWDAIYYPMWSYGYDEFFIHVSHDSFVSLVTRTQEFREKVFDLLTNVDLAPKLGHELRTARFCRPQ